MSPEKPTAPIDEYGRYPGISQPALPSLCETRSSEGRVQILVEFFNRIYRARRQEDDCDRFRGTEIYESFEPDYDVNIAKHKKTCSMTSPLQSDDSMAGQEFSEDRKFTLSDFGASTLLPPSMYLIWRVLVFLFSCVVLTWAALLGPSLEAIIPLVSSIISFFMASKMVFWTLLHRKWKKNQENLNTREKEYRWDALMFQTNFHLSFMSVVSLLICSLFGRADGETQNAFLWTKLGFYLLLVNVVILVIDVLFTPIPFKFVSVFIAAVIVTGLTLITFRPATTIERQTGVGAVGATSLVVGLAWHVMYRAIHLKLGKRKRRKGRDDSRDEEVPYGPEIISE